LEKDEADAEERESMGINMNTQRYVFVLHTETVQWANRKKKNDRRFSILFTFPFVSP
jgi:hypothetical protein